jgi:Arc-like DNA binding domain
MKDKVVNLNLRLPPDLHAKLAEQARTSNRSLNGEIIERLAGRPADLPAELRWGEIRPELRGLVQLLATVMDVAGRSRFGIGTLYSPENVPDWIADPDGYAVAAAAAARALEALHPPQTAAASTNAEDAAALAETNRAHGEAVAQMILNRISRDEPSDRRTEALRRELGALAERIEPTEERPGAADFEPVWIRPMTAEQRVRWEAQRASAGVGRT